MDWKKLISQLVDSGMNQVEIARAVGCWQATISELYRGETKDPRSSVGFALIALAKRRGIETDMPSSREAVQRATGKDKSEVVRDVLHKWAASEIHASNVLHTILRREGIGGASEGGPGK